MDDPPSCSFQLTQRIVLFTATIVLCLETATRIIFDRRFKRSQMMHLHIMCAVSWGLNAVLYGVSFNVTGLPYVVTNEISITFDGIARCSLMFNIYNRTMCVMFDVSDRVRRAYTVAMVFVCLWVTAANIALFIAYLSTNGNFQFDVVNLIYIVGVVLDLTFCVASDILYIRALVASQRFRPAGKGPSVDEILILCNIAFITAIQAISITLLFVGVDQEYAYHVCTTAIRIRFFAFVVQFTEDVLSDNGAVSNAKGVTSVSVFDRFKQPSVLTHPRPMSDVGNERQVGPVV